MSNKASINSYQQAAKVLVNDGVICYPTEAVWGLGCNPRSFDAFERILTIKKRAKEKGVILIGATESHITPYAHIPDSLRKKLQQIWPGFVTCLLPKTARCPSYLTGGQDKVAVRISAYQPVVNLCLAADSALVSTSANVSGQIPVSDIYSAQNTFGEAVDYYLDAGLGGEKKPSRIIDFTQQPPALIRD